MNSFSIKIESYNIKGIRTILFGLIIAICSLSLSGCAEQVAQPEEGTTAIYYLNVDETKVETYYQVIEATSVEGQLEEMLTALSHSPERLEYKAPLGLGVSIIGKTLTGEGWLTIDFGDEYRDLSPTTEVLIRAAIVRTITQIEGINNVIFTIEQNPLYDNAGEQVGWMNADSFINNDGNAINTYDEVQVKLYFANEAGDGLIEIIRDKFYSTNTPLERFVVDELISGPEGTVEGVFPSINASTKIISISAKDGICYVNLDNSFLNIESNVSTELSIYALVNSLTELSYINKVQILINGEVPENFSASVFEKNLDVVTTLKG